MRICQSKRWCDMDLSAVDKSKLYYLASPYSKYPRGQEAAFSDVCKIASFLVRHKINIFSPIAHSHPIAVHGRMDLMDYKIWLPLDFAISKCCDGLIVAMLQGYDTSFGINEEIKWFRREKNVEAIFLGVEDILAQGGQR